MATSLMPSQQWLSKLLIEGLWKLGVHYFTFASGARNAPLILELLSQQRKISLFSFVDERALGFHALGHCKASAEVTAVITTSGSALANCMPAVLEASSSELPLLLLTASRPAKLSFVRENQALPQQNFFAPFALQSLSLPEVEDIKNTEAEDFRRKLFAHLALMFRSLKKKKGVLHINVPFREPLFDTLVTRTASAKKTLQKPRSFFKLQLDDPSAKERSYGYYEAARSSLLSSKPSVTLKHFALNHMKARRGLIISGLTKASDYTLETALAIGKLACLLGWPVFADALSPLRLQACCQADSSKNKNNKTGLHENGEDGRDIYFEHELGPFLSSLNAKQNFDFVLHFGGVFVSKKLLDVFRKYKPKTYLHVDTSASLYNPASCVTHRMMYPEIQSLLQATDLFLKKLPKKTNMASYRKSEASLSLKKASKDFSAGQSWQETIEKKASSFVFEKFSELAIFRQLILFSRQRKKRISLFLGNSMPIRSFSAMPLAHNFLKVHGSRGLSGIDGIISTASGIAAGSSERLLLVLGDLSALYDMNALLLLSKMQQTLKKNIGIILINNAGGGIFRSLPFIEKFSSAKKLDAFLFKHEFHFSDICKTCHIHYAKVTAEKAFHKKLKTLFKKNQNFVLEAFVSSTESLSEQRRFNKNLLVK